MKKEDSFNLSNDAVSDETPASSVNQGRTSDAVEATVAPSTPEVASDAAVDPVKLAKFNHILELTSELIKAEERDEPIAMVYSKIHGETKSSIWNPKGGHVKSTKIVETENSAYMKTEETTMLKYPENKTQRNNAIKDACNDATQTEVGKFYGLLQPAVSKIKNEEPAPEIGSQQNAVDEQSDGSLQKPNAEQQQTAEILEDPQASNDDSIEDLKFTDVTDDDSDFDAGSDIEDAS